MSFTMFTTTEQKTNNLPLPTRLYSGLTAFALFLACIQFTACKSAKDNVFGTYYLKNKSATIILQTDSSFIFKTQTRDSTFINKGFFNYTHNNLQLTSLPGNINHAQTISDSITFFTSINSFSFWNTENEPIDIRRIQINNDPSKAHYGNSLYYFEQDFKPTDTIRFYFANYPSVSYPGDIKMIPGNNGHKVTLLPVYLPHIFNKNPFIVKRNKLIDKNGKQNWKKKK